MKLSGRKSSQLSENGAAQPLSAGLSEACHRSASLLLVSHLTVSAAEKYVKHVSTRDVPKSPVDGSEPDAMIQSRARVVEIAECATGCRARRSPHPPDTPMAYWAGHRLAGTAGIGTTRPSSADPRTTNSPLSLGRRPSSAAGEPHYPAPRMSTVTTGPRR